jgi:hypothetical protein
VLTPADSSHIDPSNVLYFPDGIKSGAIAINQPCDGASLDDDQDRVYDIDELNCGGDPLNGLTRPERTDGSFAGVSDDGDALVDEPLPAGSATFDCDGDGWRGDDENIVFSVAPITTSDQDPCGNNGWAAELAAGDNVLNIADLNSFLSPTRPTNDGHGNFNKFGHPVPDSDPNIARWDIDPNSIVNIGDLNALSPGVMAATSRPPMFGGQPAFFTDPDGPGPMSVGQCPWPL